MKISTKGRYAVRMLIDLALCESGKYIPLKDIAQRQDISVKYLEQIVNILNKAGYVRSIRGTQGGYRLALSADKITVGSVLRLTEGSLSCAACLEYEHNDCPRAESCATVGLWKKINDAISGVVDNVTIAELAEKEIMNDRGANI